MVLPPHLQVSKCCLALLQCCLCLHHAGLEVSHPLVQLCLLPLQCCRLAVQLLLSLHCGDLDGLNLVVAVEVHDRHCRHM